MAAITIEQMLTNAQGGMTDARLNEVFEMVKPAENWKFPIDARVHCEAASAHEISHAVTWFCGGVPTIIAEGSFLRVTGAGYYEWVGA